MSITFPVKWRDKLTKDQLCKLDRLILRVEEETNAGKELFPPKNQIFRALELTPPEKVKAIIIGQDPYHTPGQANGLAFSINNGNPVQPSLSNIFEELCRDTGCPRPTTTDLTPWAEQGVLLLNPVLTVYAHNANSCANWGWQDITMPILESCMHLPQPVVYIAWGRPAKKIIDQFEYARSVNKHAIWSTHPSPFSAAKPSTKAPAFFGSCPFSAANKILRQYGMQPVNWTLP